MPGAKFLQHLEAGHWALALLLAWGKCQVVPTLTWQESIQSMDEESEAFLLCDVLVPLAKLKSVVNITPPEIVTYQLQEYELAHSKQINLLVADNRFPPFTGMLFMVSSHNQSRNHCIQSARGATIYLKVGTIVQQSQHSQRVHTKLQGPLFLASWSGPSLLASCLPVSQQLQHKIAWHPPQ